jgi:hypothetical protein
MPTSCSAWWLSIAAVLAPLFSIVAFSGVRFYLIALLKNGRAALRSRLAVIRKSAGDAAPVICGSQVYGRLHCIPIFVETIS